MIMRIVFVAFIVVGIALVTARAQNNWTTTNLTGITNLCGCLDSQGHCCTFADSHCDNNDRTPDEVIDCKLAYWRERSEEANKRIDQAVKDFSHANERIRAFEQAKEH